MRRTQTEALRAALKRLNQTPEDFGRLIGVTTRAVQLWLKGDRSIPTPVIILMRLLLTEKITVGDLFKMRGIALSRGKKGPAALRTSENIWEKLYSNAKEVVKQ